MADTYLWRGGSALALASDWIDLTTGANPAQAAPGVTNIASFGPVGLIDATGTISIGTVFLAADLALSGVLAAGSIILQGGTIDLTAGGAVPIATGTANAGTLAIGSTGLVLGTGRIDAAITLNGLLQASGGPLGLFGAINGTGTLAIAPAAALFAEGAVGAGLTAAFQGSTATLSLYGIGAQFSAAVTGFAAGDVIDIAGVALTSETWQSGTLALADAAAARISLDLPGSYANSHFMLLPDGLGGTAVMLATGIALPAQTGSLVLSGGSEPSLYSGTGTAEHVAASGLVGLAGHLQADTLDQSGLFGVFEGGSLAAGSLALAGTLAVLDGGIVSADTVVLAGGTLSVDPASAAAVGGASPIGGAVDLGVAGGIAGEGQINAALDGAGGITASGGVLSLFGPVTGSGTLMVGIGATLFVADGVGADFTAAFAGPDATLEIAAPRSFDATLSGFMLGDALDVAGTTLDGATWSQGTLTLTDPGSPVATLAISGNYADDRLRTGSDGLGGTLVSIACFCAGTRIATPTGPVPVQRLRPGDVVLTPSGPRPLRWIGRARHDAVTASEARPVRVRRGALAPDVPCRDLMLSPEHGLRIEGVLVPAVALIEGRRVVRGNASSVSFYHIGMETHDMVLAEGAWAETFLPDDTVVRFDLEIGKRPALGPSRLPRLASGAELEALRRRLPLCPPGELRGHLERIVPEASEQIRLEGWALNAADPLRPVDLEVLRDGAQVARVVANLWRPDLDRAGLGEGRCAFVVTLPGPTTGIALRRLADGAHLPSAVKSDQTGSDAP